MTNSNNHLLPATALVGITFMMCNTGALAISDIANKILRGDLSSGMIVLYFCQNPPIIIVETSLKSYDGTILGKQQGKTAIGCEYPVSIIVMKISLISPIPRNSLSLTPLLPLAISGRNT